MMEQKPLVSIICLVYNHENFVRDALDGFIMQKVNFPFEVIIHDDASTDNSSQIIREYERKYPDIIKPIYQTENQYFKERGRVTKIVYGAAKGKYIALCEGDDYWTDPLKLQKQVDFLEQNPDHILCVGGFKNYNVNTGDYGETIKYIDNKKMNYSFRLEDTLGFWMTKTLTALFRNDRQVLNQSMKYGYGRDVHLFYHLLKLGKGYYFTNILGVYRMHDEGVHSLQQKRTRFVAGYKISKELYETNKDNYTRRSYFRVVLNLLNYEIFKKEHGNFCVKKRQLFKEAISLLRTPREFMLLGIILIPPDLKLKLKEFLPRL